MIFVKMKIFKNYAAYRQTVSRVYEWSEWKSNPSFKIDKAVNAMISGIRENPPLRVTLGELTFHLFL